MRPGPDGCGDQNTASRLAPAVNAGFAGSSSRPRRATDGRYFASATIVFTAAVEPPLTSISIM
jgi:hypothetical protein